MPYWNISAINSTNFETLYVSTNYVAPWLMPLVLFFIFSIIFVSGVVGQSKRIGYSNVPMWGAIAGLITTTISFFWSVSSTVIAGQTITLVSLSTIGVCLAVSFAFALWFFLSDNEY